MSVAWVSGMQSSCKSRDITVCSANKHNIIANTLKMTLFATSSSNQDSLEHAQHKSESLLITILYEFFFLFYRLVQENSFIIVSGFPEILYICPAMVEAFRNPHLSLGAFLAFLAVVFFHNLSRILKTC